MIPSFAPCKSENSMTETTTDLFLALVRHGIGHGVIEKQNTPIDWSALKALAHRQELDAVVVDALNTDATLLMESMPLEMKLSWIGEVLNNYETRYEVYERTIGALAGFYHVHGFKMMVLKGYVCSLNWPNPKHRLCGDIDIWLFGRQKEADEALLEVARNKNILQFTIDGSHHHHTVFECMGFTVENHYDFVNVYAHRGGRRLEAVLKELGQDDSHSMMVGGEVVYCPSVKLHSLFLVRHLANHFASSEINVRQVLDWAFFAQHYAREIDWIWLKGQLKDFHLLDFFHCVNAICVEDLGFAADIFPPVQAETRLKERILTEILSPAVSGEQPGLLLSRIVWKYRRWVGNRWKHRLVYDESMLYAFLRGAWGHLLKPRSI